jgi:6-phosphofructo-2-kinase/fructose-2,6-biphosphatase 2
LIEARVAKEKGFLLIFIESICTDPAIIAANMAMKVASANPAYANSSPEAVRNDFLRQMREHEKRYETITEPHLSYLRIANVGAEVTVSRIHDYLPSCVVFFLMNLHLKPRSIYLSRVRDLVPIILPVTSLTFVTARRKSVRGGGKSWW